MPLRTPAWALAMALAACPLGSAPMPAQSGAKNVLVATMLADLSQQFVGVMFSEQTCWVAAAALTKDSIIQVFYCVSESKRAPAPPPVPPLKGGAVL